MQDLFGAVGAASDASGGASGGVRGDTAGTEAGMRDWPGEVAYWKERFEKLHAIRETVPEEELKLFREHAQERDQAAQEYISHLRCEGNAYGHKCVLIGRDVCECPVFFCCVCLPVCVWAFVSHLFKSLSGAAFVSESHPIKSQGRLNIRKYKSNTVPFRGIEGWGEGEGCLCC